MHFQILELLQRMLMFGSNDDFAVEVILSRNSVMLLMLLKNKWVSHLTSMGFLVRIGSDFSATCSFLSCVPLLPFSC
jgi:hypothetical protein